MMYKFITNYKHKGKTFGCEIYAKSWKQAEKILKSKRETEKIVGYDPTIEYLNQ